MFSLLLRQIIRPKTKRYININCVNYKCSNTYHKCAIIKKLSYFDNKCNYSQFQKCFLTTLVKPTFHNNLSLYISKYFSSSSLQLDIHEEALNVGKKFIEHENETYHQYLERTEVYADTIHRSDSKLGSCNLSDQEFNDIISIECWTKRSADEYFTCFAKVAVYCTKSLQRISDPLFANLCKAFPSKCVYFSDEQLLKTFLCLQNWPNAPSVQEPNFLMVWKALDAECIKRRLNWSTRDTLLMIDLWYSLRLTRLSAYVIMSVNKIIDRKRKLSQQSLVQLMFYINTLRKVPKGGSLYEIEHQLTNVIKLLTIEEIAIVCAGFFKSQTSIASSNIINDIIYALIKNKDSITNFNLAIILKLIRYTCKDKNTDAIIEMLDNYAPLMKRFNIQVNVHMALTCLPKRIVHHQTLNNLFEQFVASPKDARLKDMTFIAELIVHLNIKNELANKVCQVILSELESPQRSEELAGHRRALIKCLAHLSMNNVFSENLTNKVLNTSFIRSTYSSNYSTACELLQLDQNMPFCSSDYKGNRLPIDLVSYLSKRFSLWLPGSFEFVNKETKLENNLRKFINALKLVCNDNDNLWYCGHFLPHFRNPEVLIHIDKKKRFLDIPHEIKGRPLFTGYVPAPKSTYNQLVAFFLPNKLNFTNERKLVGESVCKLRLLKSIGYTPIVISPYDVSLSDSTDKWAELIKERIRTL